MQTSVFQRHDGQLKTTGYGNHVAAFLTEGQYLDGALWAKFVNQFRERNDGFNTGWRGEYWGKSMRGAAMIYAYSKNPALYAAMKTTVLDMMTVADTDGEVTSYSGDGRYRYWDLWCRKYVMLGMEYFLEICEEPELRCQIVSFLQVVADVILANVGEKKGQVPITDSHRWRGVNSSSLLEPMVKLYRLTEQKKYLDFASYILSAGGAENCDFFRMALEDRLFPYQYGISKAYETISCFEGVLEYYAVTGEEKYRTMAINFGKAVAKTDITVVGSCGCTHELFDHSAARQTISTDGVMQETCVTVTWMKYCSRLLELTGESVFADYMEQSFSNAYLGALNTGHRVSGYMADKFKRRYGVPHIVDSFLPFDSYSPLTTGKRGQKVGGNQLLTDGTYFGCCAAIAGAGVGVWMQDLFCKTGNGIVLNFFEPCKWETTVNGEKMTVDVQTSYPCGNTVSVSLRKSGKDPISLRVRIPKWSKKTDVKSEFGDYRMESGYAVWEDITEGGNVHLTFDFSVEVLKPQIWESDVLYVEYDVPEEYTLKATEVHQTEAERQYFALRRGPLMMAAEERLGTDPDTVFHPDLQTATFDCRLDGSVLGCRPQVVMRCKDTDGKELTFADYASVGRDWNSKIAVWLKSGEERRNEGH